MKKVMAIILVAGSSTRYGNGINKNFEVVNGRTILSYSLRKFIDNERINEIVVVIREQDRKQVECIVDKERSSKSVKIVYGGKTRQESVYNGLKDVNKGIVIIHDGARPCVKREHIDKCIDAMEEYKGATIGVKAKDTIKIVDDKGVVIKTTDRDKTWIVQTPQCFDVKVLKELHSKYRDKIYTDDCMLLENDGIAVKIIEGDYTNIKITTKGDLSIVQEFLKNEVN